MSPPGQGRAGKGEQMGWHVSRRTISASTRRHRRRCAVPGVHQPSCPCPFTPGRRAPMPEEPRGWSASQSCARRRRGVNSGDMSRNGKAGPAPADGWLDGDQQRAWLAYIRVQLRLAYEMNRQLLADSGMSLPDYDVLTALNVADGGRMPITVLAAQIGWERSRVSHHVRRMSARGLVTCGLSAADRRVTEVTLTAPGGRPGRRGARTRGPCPAPVFRRAAGRPGGAAQRGTGKRVRQHHQTGLAAAAGRLAPGGGLTRPRPRRFGPAPAGNRRAWDWRGTRQPLISPLPGRARGPAAPGALAPRGRWATRSS